MTTFENPKDTSRRRFMAMAGGAAGIALGSYMAGAIYTQVGSSLAGSAVQGR